MRSAPANSSILDRPNVSRHLANSRCTSTHKNGHWLRAAGATVLPLAAPGSPAAGPVRMRRRAGLARASGAAVRGQEAAFHPNEPPSRFHLRGPRILQGSRSSATGRGLCPVTAARGAPPARPAGAWGAGWGGDSGWERRHGLRAPALSRAGPGAARPARPRARAAPEAPPGNPRPLPSPAAGTRGEIGEFGNDSCAQPRMTNGSN